MPQKMRDPLAGFRSVNLCLLAMRGSAECPLGRGARGGLALKGAVVNKVTPSDELLYTSSPHGNILQSSYTKKRCFNVTNELGLLTQQNDRLCFIAVPEGNATRGWLIQAAMPAKV